MVGATPFFDGRSGQRHQLQPTGGLREPWLAQQFKQSQEKLGSQHTCTSFSALVEMTPVYLDIMFRMLDTASLM